VFCGKGQGVAEKEVEREGIGRFGVKKLIFLTYLDFLLFAHI